MRIGSVPVRDVGREVVRDATPAVAWCTLCDHVLFKDTGSVWPQGLSHLDRNLRIPPASST